KAASGRFFLGRCFTVVDIRIYRRPAHAGHRRPWARAPGNRGPDRSAVSQQRLSSFFAVITI
ncbi:hypothetical protein L2215_17460, partial [Xanthomonas perforans]|uniref:hypothetical protein n=1 Tax=Xanthomonas perforans TaxID=442694 RepID=UPI001F2A10A5